MIADCRKTFWLIVTALMCLAPCISGQDQKTQVPLFKVSVDTVFAKVVVTDPWNRNVTGLQKEDFRVYEDRVRQTIVHFSQQSAPVSVGFIFDISNSMVQNRYLSASKSWFTQLMKSAGSNPEDEYFLITFNQKINLVQAFTNDTAELQYDLAMQKPGGWTALYDAVTKIKLPVLVMAGNGGPDGARSRVLYERIASKDKTLKLYEGLLHEIFNEPEYPQVMADMENWLTAHI